MNRKVLIALFIALTVALSINAVCANDATADLNTIDDSSPELSIADEDILTKQSEDTSFSGLNTKINSGEDIIEITANYTFNDETDGGFIRGIKIEDDNIIINGNYHTIDAKNKSRIFYITGKNIIINNLILKNANDCAIVNYGTLKTDNVEFNNCSSDDGGAVYMENAAYVSENCRFLNNYASNRGAAIYASESSIYINNTLFENNKMVWSSIYSDNCTVDIEHTTFANSTSKYATAIYNRESEITINKSRFVNLFANNTAGALAFKENNNVTIENCEFINISSTKNGGAIFTDITGSRYGEGYVSIYNTLFENCTSEFGGAHLQLGGMLKITNSEFINNYADYNGGAIYLSGVYSSIEKSIFQDNYVNTTDDEYPTYGGAIFIDNTLSNNITNCRFTNNHAAKGSALYFYDSSYYIDELEFNGNDNAVYTVFDRKGSEIGDLYGSDDIYKSDFNNEYYPNMIEGAGMPIMLLNNTDATDIPSYYDLREKNLVTPVRDQGYMGACWAFGMTATLESALLKAVNYTADFSENNMQNSMLVYSIYGGNAIEGGDFTMSMAYLLSWLGAFPQDYDSYDELGKISAVITTDEDIHIQDIAVIRNTPGNPDSITDIKKAILKYGSLTADLLSKSTSDEGEPTNYYNNNTYAEYVPDLNYTNHEVSVVGWNDDFSASNFLITPPGDGAWIIKNSWGSDWGDKGYFYVSYYDQTLCPNPNDIMKSFIAIVIENTVPYTKNYQYDFTGIDGGFYDNGKPVTYLNNFEAYDDDFIAAVGTYFDDEGIEYTVEIIVNGEIIHTQTGTSPYYGYHTIELEQYIPIKKGDKFAAAITSNKMPLCKDSRVHYENKTSLIYFNEREYEDLSSEGMVACIKVYTIEDNRHNTTLITPNRIIGVNDAANGYDYQFILKDVNGTVLANKEVVVSFNGENQTVTTDENGWGTATLTANTEGTYNVEITFEGDVSYFEISQNASIKLVRQNTNFVAPDRVVSVREMSKGYKYSAILKDNTGKTLANKKVLFIVDGKKQVTFTDENGWATVTLSAVNAGVQTVTIKFAGDRYYRETSTTKTIKIVRETSILSVPQKTFKATDKNKKVTATLKSKSGNAIYGAKVTLTVNGKTYAADTNNNGIATFTIDLTKTGTYTAIAKFAESRFYSATTTTSKIIIT